MPISFWDTTYRSIDEAHDKLAAAISARNVSEAKLSLCRFGRARTSDPAEIANWDQWATEYAESVISRQAWVGYWEREIARVPQAA